MSVFVHVTLVPTSTVRLAGLYAARPSVDAPIGMLTADDGTLGDGAGDGVGDGDGAGDE
jgi:hypothetical protein